MNYVSLPVVIIGAMLISAALLATLVKVTTPASSAPQEIHIYIRCPACGSTLKVLPAVDEQPTD